MLATDAIAPQFEPLEQTAGMRFFDAHDLFDGGRDAFGGQADLSQELAAVAVGNKAVRST